MTIFVVIIWGIFGAILGEAVKQRQKWETLSEEKFRAQLTSVKFWSTVIFLMACGGVASYFLFEDAAGKISSYSCFAAGAGAQALLRNIGASASAGKTRRFGFGRAEAEAAVEHRLTWREILS